MSEKQLETRKEAKRRSPMADSKGETTHASLEPWMGIYLAHQLGKTMETSWASCSAKTTACCLVHMTGSC